jgi:hypothetical protein
MAQHTHGLSRVTASNDKGTAMTDLDATLASITRPRLLIRAARHGVEDYRRTRDLRRILRDDVLPGPVAAVTRLIDLEAQHDARRRAGDAGYTIAAHLDVLIALMAEARALTPRVPALETAGAAETAAGGPAPETKAAA